MSEVPHYVRGSSLEIEISWFHFVVQQVLRALPAETKVDGLPRASSSIFFTVLLLFLVGAPIRELAAKVPEE